MKRTQLRSKDLSKELGDYTIEISKKDQVELIEDKYKIIFINKKPSFFYYNKHLVPTLKFLVNGADIMRPGIVDVEEGIAKEDFVTIIDKNNHKPLAVGIALFNSEEIKSMGSGKVIKNIHYVGDELWKIEV